MNLSNGALTACLTALVASVPAQSRPASAPAEHRIVGTVLDALGEPVPLAEVWAIAPWPMPRENEPRLAEAKTDGSGMFVMRVPRGEQHSVVVCATAPGRTLESQGCFLEEPPGQSAVRLRLWDAGPLGGRVLDPKGVPIAGSAVCARGSSRVAVGLRCNATTDASGRYALDHVPLGAIQLAAWSEGHVLTGKPWSLLNGGDADLTLEPGEGIRISVRVTDLPAGRSASTIVMSQGLSPLPLPLAGGRLTPDGTWTRAGYQAAEMNVFVVPDVHTQSMQLRFEPQVHQFPAEKKLHDLLFRASAAQATHLSGCLRDRDGHPLAGETVTCRPAVSAFMRSGQAPESRATTDSSGRFEMTCTLPEGFDAALVLAGTRLVLAQKKGKEHTGYANTGYDTQYELKIRDVADLVLTAEPAAAARGKVVDARGAPVAFREVKLMRFDERQPGAIWPIASASTDRDGAFSVEGLRGSRTHLRIALGWTSTATSESFALAPGDSVDSLVVTAPDLGSVGGVVRDAAGKPVPGARVWLMPSGNEVLADRAGRYRHLDVEPGEHGVEFHAGPAGPNEKASAESERFEVKPGQKLERDLVLK